MNGHAYWSALQRQHRRSMSTSAAPSREDRTLNLAVAATCALAAVSVILTGGYWTGFDAMYGLGKRLPAALVEILSKPGDTLVAICLVALFARRQPRALWMGILASGYAAIVVQVIKQACTTARPAGLLGDWVTVTGPILKAYSFPSGHATTAFLLAACFSVGAPRSIKLLLLALAAVVGASRVWIGAHWPIDVIAGAAIAGISVVLALSTMRFLHWGEGLKPHLAFVSAVAACAVAEFIRSQQDPLAHLLSVAVATTALAVLARDYVFQVLSSGRDAARPITPASAREQV